MKVGIFADPHPALHGTVSRLQVDCAGCQLPFGRVKPVLQEHYHPGTEHTLDGICHPFFHMLRNPESNSRPTFQKT